MVVAIRDTLDGVFVAVGVLWVVMALRTKRTVARGRGFVPILLAVFVLGSLGHAVLRGSAWDHRFWTAGDALAAVALVLGAAGAAFCVWARFTIAGNWSGAIVLKEDHQLVTWGPYALARHPIYTGIIAGFAAEFLLIGRVYALLALALAAAAFVVKSRAEERLMTTAFPDEYPAYRARVKAIIPYLA